jgi:hypothetical protein
MGFFGLFKSNFARIAENTTKYYLELSKNYEKRFRDEVALLTTAGVLDAQNYVFSEQSLDVDTIIDMAKKAVSQEREEPTAYQKAKVQALMALSASDFVKYIRQEDKLEKDTLFNFVFNLEVALFLIDNPYFTRSVLELACLQKADAIAKAIQKTRDKYRGEPLFTSVTMRFMEGPEVEEVKKILGIAD